jgi:hypothetical protein
MNTMRNNLLAFATTAALGLSAASDAQVLGGQVIGCVGGSLSGDLGNLGAPTGTGSLGGNLGGNVAGSASSGLDSVDTRDRSERAERRASNRAAQARHAVDASAAMSSSAQAVGTVSNVAAEATSAAGDSAAAAQTSHDIGGATRTTPAKRDTSAKGSKQTAEAPLAHPEIGASGNVSGNSSSASTVNRRPRAARPTQRPAARRARSAPIWHGRSTRGGPHKTGSPRRVERL